MKPKTHLTVTACALALSFAIPLRANAAPEKSAAASPSPLAASRSPAAKSARPVAFRGKIASVDTSARTFTIAGKTTSRVFKVTHRTTITKDGVAATIADIAADEAASGSYWKQDDGTLEAKALNLGPKAPRKKTKKGDDASAEPTASPSPSATAAKK